LLDDEAMHIVLDLARDAAHEIERPAAPLTAFLVGVAVGRGQSLGAAAARATQLILHSGPAGPDSPAGADSPAGSDSPADPDQDRAGGGDRGVPSGAAALGALDDLGPVRDRAGHGVRAARPVAAGPVGGAPAAQRPDRRQRAGAGAAVDRGVRQADR